MANRLLLKKNFSRQLAEAKGYIYCHLKTNKIFYFYCRRFLISQYEAKIREAVEQAKALQKAMKAGRLAAQV